MRYFFSCVAFAAFAATILAAPVIDKRHGTVFVVTDTVTVSTTVTVTNTPSGGRHHNFVPTTSSTTSSSTTSSSTTPLATPTYPPTPPTPSVTTTSSTTTSPPPPPAPATSSSTTSDASVPSPASGSFQNEVLSAHNAARAKHSAPALTYNDTLAAFAQTVSSPCVFQHSGGPYGENLAAGYDSPTAGIDAWIAEESQYDYSNPGFSESTGHYTQVVWKDSTQVGCAQFACNGANGTPGTFLTCEYSPAGNVIGYFAQNVSPS